VSKIKNNKVTISLNCRKIRNKNKPKIRLVRPLNANQDKETQDLTNFRNKTLVPSNATGCRYCQAHAVTAAARYGVEQEWLDNIWECRIHAAFSSEECAEFDFSPAASQVPDNVNKEISERFHQYRDDVEIVEMLGIISLISYPNKWNGSMGTTAEPPAVQSGNQYSGKHGFEVGKHV
jgi:hypothetical protein